MITRRDASREGLLDCVLALAECARLSVRVTRAGATIQVARMGEVPLAAREPIDIDRRTEEVLRAADGKASLGDLLAEVPRGVSDGEVLGQLEQLWRHRLVRFWPAK